MYQLLQLVQSLGGVDKVKALLAAGSGSGSSNPAVNHLTDESSRNRVIGEFSTPAPSIFAPSYATPSRNRADRIDSVETGVRSSGSVDLPRNQVRPRRPQFEPSSSPLNFDESRRPSNERSSARTQSPFNFVYNQPSDRPTLENVQPESRPENRSVDGFFVYNTPGRFGGQPATRPSNFIPTEQPDVRRDAVSVQDVRIPIRVSSGNILQLPSQPDWNAPAERRPARVRVGSSFTVDPSRRDQEIPSQPFFVSHDPITTRKPIRRRPPQRAHILHADSPGHELEERRPSPPERIPENLPATTVQPSIFRYRQPVSQPGDDLLLDFPYLDYAHSGGPQTIPTSPPVTPAPRPIQRGGGGNRARRPEPTTTTTTPRPREVESISTVDESGPPVSIDSAGNAKCGRRGVHPHPGTCGQFVVCAPTSRTGKELRAFVHHCPAEQVFVVGVGRCRPGNKEKCEVF